MTFEIEKNVPIPKQKNNGATLKYPWPTMAVEDSFFRSDTTSGKLGTAARNWAIRREPTWKFTARTVEGGVRIWRIK